MKTSYRLFGVFFLLISLILAVSTTVDAQPWEYNFGTEVKEHTSGQSTTFLPAPETSGGTARVRVGTGGGGFFIEEIASQFKLRAEAPTGGSVNKFSIQEYASGQTFSNSFPIKFSGGASGNWYFFQGTGTTFTGNTGFSGS